MSDEAHKIVDVSQVRPAPGWLLIQEECAEGTTEAGIILPDGKRPIFRVMASGPSLPDTVFNPGPDQFVLLSAEIRDLGSATQVAVGARVMTLLLAEYVAAVVEV